MKVIPWGLAVWAVIACGCTSVDPGRPEDVDEADDFRKELIVDADRVDVFLGPTSEGRDISEMGLGMFALSVINQICTKDDDLFKYVHAGNRDSEDYLRGPFQSDPEHEVGVVTIMATRGNTTQRSVVSQMLDALRSIPDRKASAREQAESRGRLATALARLKYTLQRAAAEASSPKGL